MTTVSQIRCDICGKIIEDRDKTKTFIGKVQSKNHLVFVFDGFKREGDLCFSCGLKIRDHIEQLKGGKII